MNYFDSNVLFYSIFFTLVNIAGSIRYMPNPCTNGKQATIKVGYILSSDSSDSLELYHAASSEQNCTVHLKPYLDTEGFVITLKSLDVGNGVLILNDGYEEETLTGYQSNSDEKFVFASVPGATLTITYNSLNTLWFKRQTFRLIYTSFRPGCDKSSLTYKCSNGKCIKKEFQCDGHNHCGDGSNEGCTSVGTKAGITTGCIIAIVIVVSGVIIYRRRRNSVNEETDATVVDPPPLPLSPPPSAPPGYMKPPPAQYMVNPAYYPGDQNPSSHLEPPPPYFPPDNDNGPANPNVTNNIFVVM